jgi:hypothetical protein
MKLSGRNALSVGQNFHSVRSPINRLPECGFGKLPADGHISACVSLEVNGTTRIPTTRQSNISLLTCFPILPTIYRARDLLVL